MSVLLDKFHAVEPGHLLNCICEKAAMQCHFCWNLFMAMALRSHCDGYKRMPGWTKPKSELYSHLSGSNINNRVSNN